jgi:Peptidase inhibitor I78 family
MRAIPGLVAYAALLAGCAPIEAAEEPPAREPSGACDATRVQNLIGQRATAEMGARLLRETGATTLRWGPPNSAMTMDYRADRLTVSYDSAMLIERISCG